MIFERKWFLRKMNKYAPKGYRFVMNGANGQIGMYAKDFMGNQEAKGPFVSYFSFDLLDCVYGGLLTRRSSKIDQATSLSTYIYPSELARAPHFAPDQETSDIQDGKYEIYRSVVMQRLRTPGKTLPLMMKKNAVFIQAMQDANQPLPRFLADRLHKYVNQSVWHAIEHVFSSMPICDIKFYQNLFSEKMQELGIDGKNETVNVAKKILENQYNTMAIEIDRLTYDVLPKQEKALQRATDKEQTPEKIQTLQAQIDASREKLNEQIMAQSKLLPQINYQPARMILKDQFYDKEKPVVPKIPATPALQMLKLATMRKHKVK